MKRALVRIQSDTLLAEIFGTRVRAAGTGDLHISGGLEYTVLSDTENELWAPLEVQFDIWLPTATLTRDAERRLRQLFHRDLPFELDGIKFFGTYDDGTTLATSDRSNNVGRALRFHFIPLREQYAHPD